MGVVGREGLRLCYETKNNIYRSSWWVCIPNCCIIHKRNGAMMPFVVLFFMHLWVNI